MLRIFSRVFLADILAKAAVGLQPPVPEPVDIRAISAAALIGKTSGISQLEQRGPVEDCDLESGNVHSDHDLVPDRDHIHYCGQVQEGRGTGCQG